MMMTLPSFLLALAGFAALACAMDKHYEDLFGRAAPPRVVWLFRAAGWTLLAVSLACVPFLHGTWSIGAVLWVGLLTFAALAVALFLTYRKFR